MRLRTTRIALTILALAALGACGGSDDDDAASTDDTTEETAAPDTASDDDGSSDDEGSDDGDTGSDDLGSTGNCTANGTITGDVEATLDDAPAFSAFIGDEGSYGVTLDDGVALNLLYVSGIDVNATLTGPDVLLRATPDGIDLALDGSGGTIDADFDGPVAAPGSAHVTVEISCG